MKLVALVVSVAAEFPAVALRAGRAAGLAASIAACSLTGCTSITNRVGTSEDVHAVRQERQQETIAEFDARRNAAQYRAALGRLQCGDADAARTMIEALVARNAEYLPARLLLAEILLESRQPELALEHARFVVDRAPDEASPRHVEGLVLEALGRSDEALASFQQAADLEPENEVYRLSFATTADHIAGHIAGRTAADAVPSPADIEGTLAAAAAALQRNAAEESIQLLSSSLKRAPDDPRLWRALGLSHYRRGDYDAAQSALTKAVSLDSGDPLSYFLLGATLRQLGQTPEAERYLAAAAEFDPRYAAWR